MIIWAYSPYINKLKKNKYIYNKNFIYYKYI